MENKKLVVTIPAFNEDKTIRKVIKDIPDINGIDTTVLVINDGSTDNTAKVAKAAGAKVISFAANRGLVSAFTTGIKHALSYDVDIILNLDGDGQHDSRDIPRIIAPILNNKADVVVGSRFLGKYKHSSIIKHFGNRAFSKLISILINQKISDGQSGFRAITREVAKTLKIRRGYTYTQQMLIQAAYHRFRIKDVPIDVKARKSGKSRLIKNPFSFAYNAGSLLANILAIYYPLRSFGTAGLILVIFGGILGLVFPRLDILSSLVINSGIMFVMFGILFEIIKND